MHESHSIWKYLFCCRAMSYLSCCCRVSSSVIFETRSIFSSISLHPTQEKSHKVSVSSTAHDYKYLLYCRAVSSLSCCLLVSSSVSVLSKSTFSLHLTEDIHKGHTVSITVHSWLYIPLMLQSCVLPLQLSSGDLSCHLVNLLLYETASNTCTDVSYTGWSGNFSVYIHSSYIPHKYLLYCRAVSSLSNCRLVSSAAIWSTFCSIKLHMTNTRRTHVRLSSDTSSF